MTDGIVPLLGLAGQLPQHIFCAGVRGVDFELLLEFFLRPFRGIGGRVWLRQQ